MNHTMRFEDAEALAPEKRQGDLYVGPDWIAYVAFKKGSMSTLGMVFFTLIWFIVRAQKMENWRDSLRGKSVEEMVGECPGSWMLSMSRVRSMDRKFPSTLVVTTDDGAVYRISVPGLPRLKEHAEKQGWPLK